MKYKDLNKNAMYKSVNIPEAQENVIKSFLNKGFKFADNPGKIVELRKEKLFVVLVTKVYCDGSYEDVYDIKKEKTLATFKVLRKNGLPVKQAKAIISDLKEEIFLY